MMYKFAAFLIFVVPPAIVFSAPVELRSADGFITIEGEVVGFDGTMVTVASTVGRVNVPVSQVGCYGAGCASLVTENDFGLTAADFLGVFAGADENLSVAGAAPDAAVASVDFARDGSAGVFDPLAAAYAATGQAVPLSIADQGGSSDVRIGTVLLTDLAEVAYPAPADWAMTAQPTQQMLGLDALVVVAPGNIGVSGISVAQLAAIYAGEITNWSELGGADTAILTLQLPESSPTRAALNRIIMAPAGKEIADSVLIMADEQSIAASVNQLPGSLSVIGFGNLGDNQALSVSGRCGPAVTPTTFNIISGDYPLLLPVMASADPLDSTSQVRAFFDFAMTSVAQMGIAAAGYVNQSAMIQDHAEKTARLGGLLEATLTDAERLVAAQMFQEMSQADRLSPTLFGGPVSAPQAAWNRAMFLLLDDLLKTPDYAGRAVVFVGYAISPDGDEAAITLSRTAAADLRAAFAQFAPDTVQNNSLQLSSRGFGSIAPTTCYSGQTGPAAQSRVEVWVR
ncbi:substrate-binding domain-containing protein [Yoonia sp.]|uniref:PstS family phosphate ABC transporter substrate-binding protein n=1 Tax=Yoonia sp. TaxID=2212373 RepID=UPI0019DB8EA3|nr:substrate-binding domain-containing protein [Yoonia sp.]MBE0412233.1 substrate-binding domain-containing protein [Yoonia sp.]